MESLFRSLKCEWIPVLGYRNSDAQKGYRRYLMDYYNRQRPHTFNDGMRPLPLKKNLKYCPGLVDHYSSAEGVFTGRNMESSPFASMKQRFLTLITDLNQGGGQRLTKASRP